MADVDASRIAVNGPDPDYDWRTVARHVLVSRALDRLEEERLVPERKVLYQFSARGHDMAQVLLGSRLTHARDATCGYYRSRPLLLWPLRLRLRRNAPSMPTRRCTRRLAVGWRWRWRSR